MTPAVEQQDPVITALMLRLRALPQPCRATAFTLCIYTARARSDADDAPIAKTLGKVHYNRLLTTGSTGLDRREDRALSNFLMAADHALLATPEGDARALETIRQIVVPPVTA